MKGSRRESAAGCVRLKLAVRGAVQGVGFRPFVFRLASELRLRGWVQNSSQGVLIEAEGDPADLRALLLRLEAEQPPRSSIQSLEASWLDAAGHTAFEIRASATGGAKTALVLPDIATCPDCLREIFTPGDRRYGYAFTNCTNCGPRFTIIRQLPYDRARTSMRGFTMCPQCQAEYEDPRNRRFHAEPNACPVCGPHLELWDRHGKALAGQPGAGLPGPALRAAADAIRAGSIVAVKGLGGFHLLVAAQDDQAVRRLRARKGREEKPFALMFPSLEKIRETCEVSPAEERLLHSPEAPIVLLPRLEAQDGLSAAVAPGNPNLGVMLPYTPLHHLLLRALEFPVVATSGNLSDEPICIDETEARERLGQIADLFLVHNRPIVRHVDDSVVRVMAGRELVLRRARGFAPLPVTVERGTPDTPPNVLGVGAHLKNAVALGVGRQVFTSQHIGDLETGQAYGAFRQVIRDFENLYEAKPAFVAADLHPDYLSTQFAHECAAGPVHLRYVQHHVAHVLSCMAENALEPPVLGVSWDGTGYGLDGTVWGGEFFLLAGRRCQRVAHFRTFRLPGGDRAVKEPRRTALGVLDAMLGDAAFEAQDLAPLRAFSAGELGPLKTMLRGGVNSPPASSVGRLFDAVASLTGLRQQVRFEGQGAMELEFALAGVDTDEAYPFAVTPRAQTVGTAAANVGDLLFAPVTSPAALVIDWFPLFQALLKDVREQVPPGLISARFHNALVAVIVEIARRSGQERVVLSGGCFQNRYLTERAVHRLSGEGFHPYWHQRVPPNDGGIALGQVIAVWLEHCPPGAESVG